ncbi:MAG: uncharacterized protein QG635_1750 [Bacteroidota bacterium]|nr:uncharacterized protein [Bacteroidota bacterium]
MKSSYKYILIAIFPVMLAALQGNSQEIIKSVLFKYEGHWEGSIDVMNTKLQIMTDFKANDVLTGTIDIPQQGVKKLQLTNFSIIHPSIKFEINIQNTKIEFSGMLAGDKITGKFTQAGYEGTFELTKTEAPPAEPGIAMQLVTSTGTINGTLLLPEGREKMPIALIIAGSGPTDRDGNSPLIEGKNNSLKMLADGLASKGIASLRYDKRGIGESIAAMKSEAELRFDDYVNDAVGWINLLKGDSRFTDVIIIGHSEGSLIGMLAAKKSKVRAYISAAGAGRKISEALTEQLKEAPEAERHEAAEIIKELKKGKMVDSISNSMQILFRRSVQPYLISWLKYDPSTEIAGLHIPVLIVQGSNDIQISEKDARQLFAKCPGSKLLIIPGMNHILKIASLDRDEIIKTYSDPNLELAPGLIDGISGFIDLALQKNKSENPKKEKGKAPGKDERKK